MRKRLLSVLLVLCMIWPPMQVTALGAEKNYNDDDVTWIGTKNEFTKTLETFFDAGLRKVPVGERADNGSLINMKYGLVDSAGAFIAQPVYDKIEAEYLPVEVSKINHYDDINTAETIFVDGYVQATRNGKMGLLNTLGKEVIPCNYDAVGLPVEGISRIIKKSGKVSYLGYWNLELGKEIVAPNKYVVSGADATAAGYPQGYEALNRSAEWSYTDEASDYYKNQNDKRLAAQFDFNGGYALVPTGKVETVSQTYAGNKSKNVVAYLVYAQVIDKKGKEILSGGPYPYRYGAKYPQAGPYMVYQKLSTKKLKLNTDAGDTVTFNSHLESGVVGEKGIIIPAQYHGGIRGNAATGWSPADANMQIIPESSLVMTAKDVYEGKKEASARFGVVNFSNKTIIPFENAYEWFKYNSENKLFTGNYVYRSDGTKIPKSDLAAYDDTGNLIVANGYFILCDENRYHYKGNVSLETGKAYTHENLHSDFRSNVSVSGTLWVNKGSNNKPKWGLVNLKGKVLLPFEYEVAGASDNWEMKKGAYATVKKNGRWGMVDTTGKEILPCKYKSISETGEGFLSLRDNSDKYGIFSLFTRKISIPCIYQGNIDMRAVIAGTVPVKIGNSLWALVDDKGKEITPAYLYMSSPDRGLFSNSNRDSLGPDGRIVFPRNANLAMYKGKQVFIGEDLTLVVKDGKVGYVNASRMAREGQTLPTTPYGKTDPMPSMNAYEKYYMVDYPEKQVYKKGEAFEIKGFIAHTEDTDGVRKVLDNSKIYFMVSGTVKVSDGYKFTMAGNKVMECYYDGVKTGFSITVKVLDPSSVGDLLDNGTYTISVYGKNLKLVNGYMELSDTKPAQKFTIDLVNYSDDRGPMYYVMTEDGEYIMQPTSKDGAQLATSHVPHPWRINKYSSFCTIRDYGNQKLIVNASGKKSSNGTKIIVWSHTGSAPDNAKLVFTPVK
jgi:hypothetical protein